MVTKTEVKDKILSLLHTLPNDRIRHTVCFKDSQLQRFSSDAVQNISERDLKLQYLSLRDLVNDKYKNYYKLDDKLLKPKGRPDYYERLLRELNGEKKETIFSAFRTVFFGK